VDSPFGFIEDTHLMKLPVLFKQLTPPQAALILAYLPPEWSSQVLSQLDAGFQSIVVQELSHPKQIDANAVKALEQEVKDKLPYLIGGGDWIQSVYQHTQADTQRNLLGTLSQQSPELAKSLRAKTFFFEDLGILSSSALRVLIQEATYPVMALAIKAEKPEFITALMGRIPAGIREFIEQEFELSNKDPKSIQDAKNRLIVIGNRLLVEGRISLEARS